MPKYHKITIKMVSNPGKGGIAGNIASSQLLVAIFRTWVNVSVEFHIFSSCPDPQSWCDDDRECIPALHLVFPVQVLHLLWPWPG